MTKFSLSVLIRCYYRKYFRHHFLRQKEREDKTDSAQWTDRKREKTRQIQHTGQTEREDKTDSAQWTDTVDRQKEKTRQIQQWTGRFKIVDRHTQRTKQVHAADRQTDAAPFSAFSAYRVFSNTGEGLGLGPGPTRINSRRCSSTKPPGTTRERRLVTSGCTSLARC